MATKKKTSAAETVEASSKPAEAAAKPPRKFPANARKKKDSAEATEVAEAAISESAAPAEATAPVEDLAQASAPAAPLPEAIRARAYALWKERGGSAMENWLQAEAELRAQA